MTTPHRIGRPKLTEEQAWASALRRVEMRVDRRIPMSDGTECMLYKGPWNIEVALDPRRVVNAQRIVAQALGYNIDSTKTKIVTTCHQKRCVSPEHVDERPIDAIPEKAPAYAKKDLSAFKASLDRMIEGGV